MIPLPLHSYQHRSTKAGVQRLVNCYAEQQPPEGKAPHSLMRAPGITTAYSGATGAGRGLVRYKQRLYAVIGNALYRISAAHAGTNLGSIAGTSICSFAQNPTDVVICDPAASYTYDETTLAQITDADFNNGAQCADLDGYILFREPNSGRFFSSDLNDANSYDALMFATAEGVSDELVGIITDHRQAVLAGELSMELWYNAGTSGFPFARDSNGFVELGCLSGGSLAKVDNSIFWLASDFTVRRLDGLTPVRVSHHGVEQAIAGYTTSDAHAFSYTHEGHIFYVLQFPTDEATWKYDATTREWHECESYGLTRWRVCSAVQCYGRTYVQDYETGKVGYIDSDVYEEFGNTQRMEFTFQDVYNRGKKIKHKMLELICETGVGTSGQGENPAVTLEYSDDAGKTWTSLPTRTLGETGEYRHRVRWHRLGASRYRVYRVSISDPGKFIVSDAQLDAA